MSNINKIVELLAEVDGLEFDDVAVEIMSLVEEPAIGVHWAAFAAQHLFVNKIPGESEDDYMGRCIPQLISEGYDQDQAAAICYAGFEKFDVNVDALPNYVDQGEDLKAKEDKFHAAVLKMAADANFGEVLDMEMTTYINLQKDSFETISDFLKAADAIDVLDQIAQSGSQLMVEPSYRYTGGIQANSRNFCTIMVGLGKIYSKAEIDALSAIPWQPGMGPGGTNTYNIFDYKGGVNCKHFWEQLRVFKSPGGRNIVISEGAAEGDAGDPAKRSNNWWRMSEQKSEWKFAEDDEQMIITGPAMKAFQLIPRRDEDGNLFHVYFSDETIKKLSEKFLKEHKQHMTDINHSMNPDEENTLIESWIVSDPEMDKSKALGFNPTKGDWYVSYKINNEKTWNQIKEGKLNGFSIAGQFIERTSTKL